jgi:hypothetical protein
MTPSRPDARWRRARAVVAMLALALASACSWLANEFTVLDRPPAPPAGAPSGTDAPR